MAKLANKVAVVTGASKGIGAAIAKKLAEEGASVVVNYSSSKEGADKVVAEIVSAGGKAIAVGANIAKEAEIKTLFDETKKAFGRVDILVNNAGIYKFGPIDTVSTEEFLKQYEVNVLGLMLTSKAAAAQFPETGGSIINIGSTSSITTPATTSIYSSTKGAVDIFTRVLAKELGPRNIRVNSVNPGYVVTEGARAGGFVGSAFEKAAIARTALGRAGLPEDIAGPVAFLASEDARWITGQLIIVSGGA